MTLVGTATVNIEICKCRKFRHFTIVHVSAAIYFRFELKGKYWCRLRVQIFSSNLTKAFRASAEYSQKKLYLRYAFVSHLRVLLLVYLCDPQLDRLFVSACFRRFVFKFYFM